MKNVLINVVQLPIVIRADRRVAELALNLVRLHELIELRLGVFDRPIAVNGSVHVQALSLFHPRLLLRSVHVRLRSEVVVLRWPVSLPKLVRREVGQVSALSR